MHAPRRLGLLALAIAPFSEIGDHESLQSRFFYKKTERLLFLFLFFTPDTRPISQRGARLEPLRLRKGNDISFCFMPKHQKRAHAHFDVSYPCTCMQFTFFSFSNQNGVILLLIYRRSDGSLVNSARLAVIDILKKEGTNTYLTEYSFVGYCNNICRC
jgi:hypothetical protein